MKRSIFTAATLILLLYSPYSALSQPMFGSYDIGGGTNDFSTIIQAIDTLNSRNMGGLVNFNVYTGVYEGQITLHSDSIQGLSAANRLIITAAAGESPRIKSYDYYVPSHYGNGFKVIGADYITICGFEIDSIQYSGVYISQGPDNDYSTYVEIENNYIQNCGLNARGYCIYADYTSDCSVNANILDGGYYNLRWQHSFNTFVYNNMAYNAETTAFQFSTGSGIQCLYNSIYHNGSYELIDAYTNTGCEIKYNILYSASSDSGECIIYTSGTAYNIFSDYNCFYNPYGISIGSLNRIVYSTLEQWQAATGFDQHSVCGNPHFVCVANDSFDLHIVDTLISPVNGMGDYVHRVPMDIDNDFRHPESPDIGADEYTMTLPQYGVSILPDSMIIRQNAGQYADYLFCVTNSGTRRDVFSLSASGTAWQVEILDSAGTAPITSTSLLASEESRYCIVRHHIPAAVLPSSVEIGYFNAVSRRNPSISDTVSFITIVSFNGSYDIGGGANDFPSIVAAVNGLNLAGMGGPVSFDVYPGTYDGQVSIHRDSLRGISAVNPLVFNALPENYNPVRVINTTGTGSTYGNGFRLFGVGYVTIRNFEVDSCDNSGFAIGGGQTADTVHHCFILNNYIKSASPGDTRCGISLYRTNSIIISSNEMYGTGCGIGNERGVHNLFTNNMLYLHSRGIDDFITNGSEYYFNSIFLEGSDGVYFNTSTGAVFKNNIVYIHGSSIISCCLNLGVPHIFQFDSDYNNLYAPNAFICLCYGFHETLLEYQEATGYDLNSISAAPGFLSTTFPYDLHISGFSPCINAGTSIAGVAVDFDGDLRNPISPCIGCDEILGIVITLSLHNPPIIIPAGGGLIRFDATLINMWNIINTVDVWSDVTLPNNHIIGPLILRRNLTLPPQSRRTRELTLLVPGSAPGGEFSYNAYVGVYPDSIYSQDNFPFVKFFDSDSSSEIEEWSVEGWSDDGPDNVDSQLPLVFDLSPAYPNPFNHRTIVTFTLEKEGFTELTVYDLTGREVTVLAEGYYPAGAFQVEWDASKVASGVYFALLTAGEYQAVRKLILIK